MIRIKSVAAQHFNDGRPRKHASRRILPLALLTFFIFAASAQAHSVSASVSCTPGVGNAVTFVWSNFADPPGPGNGGENTPGWQIVYTPTGGSPTTLSGNVSFPLATYTLTVPIPDSAGSALVSSSWTASQTTDGNAGSFSGTLPVSACTGPPPPPPPPPASPTIVTTASPGVLVGSTISDDAVLSGGNSPTGTITFNLYAASDTTCATPLATGTVPVTGNGSYTSPAVTENQAGSYQWVASYSGDANNNPVADPCGQASEQVVVTTPPPSPPLVLASPLIATTASGVGSGDKITDTATLSGGSLSPGPTGTITFKLYAGSDTSCKTALSTVTTTVNGDGAYTSPAVVEKTAGTYDWVASYSGDANNSGVAEPCGVSAEKVHVPPAPCLHTSVSLTGIIGKREGVFTAHLKGPGVEHVTFYLDGHKLTTVTKAHNGVFSVTINAAKLSYGAHTLMAKTSVSKPYCAPASRAATFIRPKPNHHFHPTG